MLELEAKAALIQNTFCTGHLSRRVNEEDPKSAGLKALQNICKTHLLAFQDSFAERGTELVKLIP